MRRCALLPALLLLGVLRLSGQAPGTGSAGQPRDGVPRESIPLDSESHWTVGITRFQGVGLSSENLYLTHSLPLLLRERLSAIHSHFFTAEERFGYREWILRQEQRRLGQSLKTLRQERDALFFGELAAPERGERLAAHDVRIRDAVARINTLNGLNPELIEFPERKDIQFKVDSGDGAAGEPVGSATGALIDEAVLSPLRIARQEQVNLLVWGTLEEVHGYLYLEVRALDAHLGREVFYYSDAAEPEELYRGLEALTADLSRTLWGRDWSSLAVDTSPDGAQVYVDGVYAGRAPVLLDYLVPGPVELRVEAPGYLAEMQRIELPAYARTDQRIVLERRPDDPLMLTSEPGGALVYNGSSWLGTTPLTLQRPEGPSRVLLRLQGYPEQVLYLGPESSAEVAVAFPVDLPNPLELQTRRRNAFYTSFGIFAASVPLPLFFWAGTNDSYAAFLLARDRDGNLPEAERLAGNVEGYYNAYLVGLGVSAALFVNMMIHLIRYIRAADRQG